MAHLTLGLDHHESDILSRSIGELSLDALPSPFSLDSPSPHSATQLHDDAASFFHSPSTLLLGAQVTRPEKELVGEQGSAIGSEVDEDESILRRREEGERRFKEAQQAAERRRSAEGSNKENSSFRPSSARAPSTSPSKGRSKKSAAWSAQERLHQEAQWEGREEGGAGWWALLHENAEHYASLHVSWVSAGEDELSVRTMERLKTEARRGSDVGVYLLWKLLTREAYYQRVGVSDARVARQLAAEFRVDPRSVDRAIELEQDLETKQRVADLLLSMS